MSLNFLFGTCCSMTKSQMHGGLDYNDVKPSMDWDRVKGPNEITMTLDRTEGRDIGIDAYPEKEHLVIKAISPGGLVDRWNRSLPLESKLRQVEVGMMIVEVDGVYGDDAKLIDACRVHKVLKITVAYN
eukprot:TRINITY_DN40875_c0_g1_i1.p1 TRINITY_DN40875_c0_g1~~TRINITY_DN40875_c0_g1_i1.p1  ORF type:complete len:129 (-),score=24.19 TRINITY_DN40875_c0_g1_i1:273-659(-)